MRRGILESPHAGDEFRGNRQLVCSEPQRFLGRRFVNARHLKHDASRFHHRDPRFRCAFAFAHAGFRRLLGEGLVRENPDPELATALDEAGDGHARCFDLTVGDPRGFHGFQTVLAERQFSTAPGFSVAPAAHLLPVLHFLRHQHRCLLASCLPWANWWPTNSLTAYISRFQTGTAVPCPYKAITLRLVCLRALSESSTRAWARSRLDKPSTSRQSRRRWFALPRCQNRCPRAASAAATGPASTIPCARFPRHSDARLRAP